MQVNHIDMGVLVCLTEKIYQQGPKYAPASSQQTYNPSAPTPSVSVRAVDPLLTTDDWKSHLKTFEDEASASELFNNNRYLDLIRAIERLEMMQADEEGTEPAILHGQGGKLELLSEITSMLWNLFRDSDDLQYLHSFIHFQTKAIQCTPNSSSDRLDRLFDLCVAYRHRFDHTGYVEDISAAIDFNAGSLVFRPRDREDFPTTRLNHLGELHQLLYERRGDSQAAVHAVDFKWLALQTISDGHPDWAEYLRGLGVSHLSRFECINFLGDIDISIECLEAAVSLVSNRHLEKPGWLTDLGIAYQTRYNCFGNLEDLENAVKWNEQANTLASDDHPEKPRLLNNLVASLLSRFMRMGRQEDVEKSVSCQKQAVLLTPDGHPYKPGRLNNLGIAHRLRYECLGRLEDLDDASISLLQALLNIEKEDPQSPVIVNNLSAIYQKLFERGGWSFDLTKSIDCCHEASSLNRNPQFDSMILNNLGVYHKLLFQQEKGREDIDKAIDYLERAVSLTPHGHLQKPEQLTNLGNVYVLRFVHQGRLEDIEKSINYHEQAVLLTPNDHFGKSALLLNLGDSLRVLFQHSGKLEDIEKAISCIENAVLATPDCPNKCQQLNTLGVMYCTRYMHSNLQEDPVRGMLACKDAALVSSGHPSIRFGASCHWAMLAQVTDHPALEAYTHVMSLISHVAWLGSLLTDRLGSLVEVQYMVPRAVVAAISAYRYDLAMEWLEQGRAVVWGQMVQLRHGFDDLGAVDQAKAEGLKILSNRLDSACLLKGMGGKMPSPLETYRIIPEHRRLAEEWERQLESIRLLPGLEDFLTPSRASKLMAMVHDGMVVTINVDSQRCDALIMRAGCQTITHVPLPAFSQAKAENARSQLAQSLRSQDLGRGIKLSSPEHKNMFRDLLCMLWYDLVKPVLDDLNITEPLPVDCLPHITWCTTGPLSFLPLHAAGDYNDHSTVLANLAVSSYTPSISALSRPIPSTFTGLLAVGHESVIRGFSSLPGAKAELDQVEAHANGSKITRLEEGEACCEAVLSAMESHSWVHFACHASQESLNPLLSAFHLHDEDLDLVKLARRDSLQNAQLAFLSACQTATGHAVLPNECVHLAAGLLALGYPTVIATMWSINDKDAPMVAGKVYECLLEGGVPDSRKAAKALHKAVTALRESLGDDEFSRWVPYIHLGR